MCLTLKRAAFLRPQESDILTEGDTVQIGPFAIVVDSVADKISLSIHLVRFLPTGRGYEAGRD
jgi:hypothetical protein